MNLQLLRVMLAALCVILAATIVYFASQTNKIPASYVATTGTIVDQTNHNGYHDTNATLTIRYSGPAGASFTTQIVVDQQSNQVGQTRTVYFDPDNPGIAKVKPARSDYILSSSAWDTILVSIALIGLIVVLAVGNRLRRQALK